MTSTIEVEEQLRSLVHRRASIRFEADRWYTIEELVALRIWSTATWAAKRVDGSGPAFTKIGRRIFYSGSDLEAFFTLNRKGSTAQISRPTGRFGKLDGRP